MARSPILNRAIQGSQINLQHCYAAHHFHLGQLASSMHTFVSLIQEPYCPFGRVPGTPPNATLHVGRTGRKVRACIITSKDLAAWTLLQFSDEDVVAVAMEISSNGRKEHLVLASAYLPYDSPFPPPSETFQNLVEFCRNRKWRLVVGSDVNAHHTQWGSSNVNDRGDALLEFILGSDLMICNQGQTPTFRTSVRSEVLDVTFASLDTWTWVKDWKVEETETYSDHRLITFDIDCSYEKVVVRYRNV